MISAGEISGDLHGARLVLELKQQNPDLNFFGMGHTKMQKAGVEILTDLTSVSTMGFIEPLLHLPKIFLSLYKLKKIMQKRKPALLIVIDYQGFHLLLAKVAQKLGIPVIYYIAPQEWQWGTKKGGKKVLSVTNKILAIFKEEADFYTSLGGNVTFVGHPLLDIVKSTTDKKSFLAELNFKPEEKILALFPGSRTQELKHIFPILLASAKAIKQLYPDIKIVISVVDDQFLPQVKKVIQRSGFSDFILYQGQTYNLIAHSYLSIVSSGTITLEHALLGTPCLINYRLNHFSYWLITTLFAQKIKEIKFIGLPNLILKKAVLPEFIQYDCNSENIKNKVVELLENKEKYEEIKANLLSVKANLGEPGVISRAAKEIIEFIRKK
jgi:lipid-A-disaccharide synthase